MLRFAEKRGWNQLALGKSQSFALAAAMRWAAAQAAAQRFKALCFVPRRSLTLRERHKE